MKYKRGPTQRATRLLQASGATLAVLSQLEHSSRHVAFDIEADKCSLALTVAKLRALLQRVTQLFNKRPRHHTCDEVGGPTSRAGQ